MKASEEGDSNSFNFLRLRIAMDTSKSLCQGRKITMADGKEGWVRFKYKRLPNICYWCGKLMHIDKECLLWEKSRGTLKARDQQFGSWLRALTPNLYRRTVIHVARLYEEELREDDGVHGDIDRDESEPGQDGVNLRDRHREGADDSPVGDALTDMEFSNFSANNKNIPSNMEIILNSLEFLNSINATNGANFKAQLEDIDEELAKFDNVEVLRGAPKISLSNRNSEQSKGAGGGVLRYTQTSPKLSAIDSLAPKAAKDFEEDDSSIHTFTTARLDAANAGGSFGSARNPKIKMQSYLLLGACHTTRHVSVLGSYSSTVSVLEPLPAS
ncbi:hypothetical protein SO802_011353 [Lithocarpus litseifolius]|uniref:Zinc knuckle CX2CX4HX4C domain-containing protein n=1 Tax=Lithocarpus litseifolius TaxID=425828 RepID=A0AAW2D0C8_9ROSI